MEYQTIHVEQALHKLKRKIPYGWDLNIYRGCEHSCTYCYAMDTPQYLPCKDFVHDIFIKDNLLECLERELSSPTWKGEVVNIGGVTDSYQPAEGEMKLMPDILRLFIKYKTPIIISTKSSLILRDFDLLAELAQLTYVNIASTIVTSDDALGKLIEPKGDSFANRCYVLKEFGKTSACTGWHLMPILPLLTDGDESLQTIFAAAQACQVEYLLPGTLYLRGNTRKYYFSFLEAQFPALVPNYRILYPTGAAIGSYKNKLYQRINELRKKYGIAGAYMDPMRARLGKNLRSYV